jgi:hypothetical protein
MAAIPVPVTVTCTQVDDVVIVCIPITPLELRATIPSGYPDLAPPEA